jgi:predicted short-subunit dehydrogenase-like oxidoreductase (DUF2520 family)
MEITLSIIGAGNLSWHLAQALDRNGVPIAEVYSRSIERAKKLVKKLYSAKAVNSLDFSRSVSDLFIIAVPDQAIAQVVADLEVPANAMVVHTSGAQPLSLLDKFYGRSGVFYPLQTFSIEKTVNFKEVPICIESAAKPVLDAMAFVGYAISRKIYHLSTEERLGLHVAAVFACNFTNQLIRMSEQILEKSGMEISFLAPLVQETIDKAFAKGPRLAQTGPASRNDQNTILEHLSYLQQHPDFVEIYARLSQLIQEDH